MFVLYIRYNKSERVTSMGNYNVEVISERTFLTLKAGEFFELEKVIKTMKNQGWNIENHPQFSLGKWRTTLSRPVVMDSFSVSF